MTFRKTSIPLQMTHEANDSRIKLFTEENKCDETKSLSFEAVSVSDLIISNAYD